MAWDAGFIWLLEITLFGFGSYISMKEIIVVTSNDVIFMQIGK